MAATPYAVWLPNPICVGCRRMMKINFPENTNLALDRVEIECVVCHRKMWVLLEHPVLTSAPKDNGTV